MREFINLIKSNIIIRNLLLVQLICDFAVWFVHMAIYTLLLQLNAPVWAITVTVGIGFFAGIVFAPFTGTIVDLLPTKSMLVSILFIEIFSVIMLMFINSLEYLWLLFLLLFIRMSLATLYFQAIMALFPKLLSKQDLKLANELNSLIWSISYTAGMALAGIFVHFYGSFMALFVNVFLYCIGVFIVIKTPILNYTSTISKNFFLNMKKGIIYLKKHPLLIHLMLLHASVGLTAYDALVALLAKFDYSSILSAALVIGLIDASRAVALSAGTFFLGKYVNEKSLVYFYIFQGLGIIFWSFMQFNFYAGLFGTFMAGICTTLLWSFTYTLIQNNTSKKYYGRVIAYNDMLFLLTGTVTTLAIGFLYKSGISLSAITFLIGLCFFGFAIYYLWTKKTYM